MPPPTATEHLPKKLCEYACDTDSLGTEETCLRYRQPRTEMSCQQDLGPHGRGGGAVPTWASEALVGTPHFEQLLILTEVTLLGFWKLELETQKAVSCLLPALSRSGGWPSGMCSKGIRSQCSASRGLRSVNIEGMVDISILHGYWLTQSVVRCGKEEEFLTQFCSNTHGSGCILSINLYNWKGFSVDYMCMCVFCIWV